MPEQLTLNLPIKTSRDRGDFFVSAPNALALARLEDTAQWAGGKLALVGPEGSGKTHLAHVWADTVGGRVLDVASLATADIAAIRSPVAVELDPPEDLAPEAEESLFHLHNHLTASGLPMLFVSRLPPARWRLSLPDLESRMSATDVVRIEPPDDALLAAVLIKLFADRQLQVAPSLIAWLTARMDRSFAEAQRIVAKLDAAAMSEGRSVNRALAQRVLDSGASEKR